MRPSLLRAIYYVTIDHFVAIPQSLTADLDYHGIKIYQVPYHSIEKFLPPKNKPISCCLILCDHPELASAFASAGYHVVGALHIDNKESHFPNIPYLVEDFEQQEWSCFVKFWQRYTGAPWHILDTERCRIREICPEDINGLYQLYSDKRICKYVDDMPTDHMVELECIKSYIKNVYCFYNYGTWVVEDRFSKKIIGRAGFNVRPGFDDPELGFLIAPSLWRHGYAYEICTALIAYGKNELGFTRIHAFVQPENTASVCLLNKLGFRTCGRYTIKDQINDRCVLDLL